MCTKNYHQIPSEFTVTKKTKFYLPAQSCLPDLQELKVKLLGLRMSLKIIERSCVPWPSETFRHRPLWSHVAFVRDNKQDKHSDAHSELGKSRGMIAE